MEPLRPGQAQRVALPHRTVTDGKFASEPTRMYSRPSTAQTGSSLTQAYLRDSVHDGKVMQRPSSAGGGSVGTQDMIGGVASSRAGDFSVRPMSSRGAFPSPTLDQLRRSVTPKLSHVTPKLSHVTPKLSQLQSSAAAANSLSKSIKVFTVPSAGVRAGEIPQRPMQRPPSAGALKIRRDLVGNSLLRKFYDRGDLPVCVDHAPGEVKIRWKVEVEKLDFHYYLPVFFDGMRELAQPYAMFARKGIQDMVTAAPSRVVAVLPQLIVPIKNALNTRHPDIIECALKMIQQLILCDARVGESLVPYYRQLLPVFNLLRARTKNLGDGIDYGQRKAGDIGALITETLDMLETHGGPDAFINIKYMIPTYESSCVS